MSFLLSKGPYCGDVSALYFISCPWVSELPLLLAGTGPQVLLYELSIGKLLHSLCCFDGVRVHGISATVHPFDACLALEPVRSIATVAVHGEGRVKLFQLVSCKENGQWQLHLQPLHTLPTLSHWVLDTLFLQESCSVIEKLRDKDGNVELLSIGLSDNSLTLWDIQVPALVYRIKSTERCLLYSMRLWGKTVETLRIAAGTIFNEVLIWKLGDDASSVSELLSKPNRTNDGKAMPESIIGFRTCAITDKPMTPLHRLTGHEGSIHRISWSADGSWIISVSDDRSARIWKHKDKEHLVKQRPILGDGDIDKGPILYGHGGRIWDCHAAEQLLVTASEDCTCRVWAPDGKHLTTLRGHTGRGIWRCVYDNDTSILITAGADSAIRVTSLLKWTRAKLSFEVDDLTETTEVFSVSSLPTGNVVNGGLTSYIDSNSEYVRCISLMGPFSLLVATNRGCLHQIDLLQDSKEHWTTYTSGYMEGPIVCMDVISPIAETGHLIPDDALSEHMIAVGNGRGQARLLKLHCAGLLSKLVWHCSWQAEAERKLLGILWCKSLGTSCVFTTDPRGGLHVWSVNYDCGSDMLIATHPESANCCVSLMAICQSLTYNQITCLDVCLQKQVLVFGEKRGNLVIASFPSSLKPTDQGAPMALVVLAVLKGAHGISGVSSILIDTASVGPGIDFFSTGKDGCICKFSSENNSGLEAIVCTGVEKIPALTIVDSLKCLVPRERKEGRKIAAGFTAGDFIIWDLQQQSELMRVPCGGWRRPFSYLSGSLPESQSCFAFVKDHAIHIHRRWIPPAVAARKNNYSQSQYQTSGIFSTQLLHDSFHGKEIQSIQFIHGHAYSCINTEAQTQSSWVATGGEDGIVRLTRFAPNSLQQQLDTSLVLGEHIGGSAVRALAVVSHTHLISQHCEAQDLSSWGKSTWAHDKALLLSVGAKEVMTCWLLEWLSDHSNLYHEKDLQTYWSPSVKENGKDCSTTTVPAFAVPTEQTLTYTWLSSCRHQKSQSAQRARQAPESNMDAGASERVRTLEKGAHIDQGSSTSEWAPQEDEPADDDLRYMAVTAFSTFCCSTGLSLIFVVTASSDSTLTVQAFDMSSRSWIKVAILKYHTAPVLALTYLVVQSSHSVSDESSKTFLVFSGATDGCIAVWDLTTVVVRTLRHCSEDGPIRSLSAPLRPLSGRGSQGGRRKKLGWYGGVEMEEGVSDMKMDNHVDDVESIGQPIHIIAAHMSGVNCISVEKLQERERLFCRRRGMEYLLVSGGDDGALHSMTFSVGVLSQDSGGEVRKGEKAGPSAAGDSFDRELEDLQPKNVLGQVCRVLVGTRVSVACAHYSALKGVWTDGQFIFSTGLDQRLRCWVLAYSTSELEDSLSNANLLSIQECAQSVIDVPEPAALHVEKATNGVYRIAVAGRGMQILSFQTLPSPASPQESMRQLPDFHTRMPGRVVC